MDLFKRSRISVELLRVVFGIYFALTLTVTLIHFAVEYRHTKQTVASELKTIESTFRESLATALWQLNHKQLEAIANGIYDLPMVVGIGVVDGNGKHLIAIGKQESSPDLYHDFAIHWQFNKEHIFLADVRIHSDSSVVIDRVKVGFMMIALNAIIKSTALWLLFLWAFRKYLGRHMEHLAEQVGEINLDDIQNRRIQLDVQHENELKLLEGRFNAMIERIESDKARLLETERERQEWLEDEVRARTRDLEAANERLTYLATIDPLTEVNNRRSFFEQFEKFFALARREQRPISLLMIDLDLFKQINDSYGHALGDQVLRHFTNGLSSQLRQSDLFGRLGGEEFAVVLNDTGLDDAHRLADQLRENVAETPLLSGKLTIDYTISIGVSERESGDIGIDDLYRRADEALYIAKEEGRNRVVSLTRAQLTNG